MINIQYYQTPVGELILGSYDNQLCMADWRHRKMRKSIDARLQKGLNAEYIEQDTLVLQQTRQQLDEYFQNKRQNFDIPLLMVGTDFQNRVWQALIDIPYGKTCSYLQLSKNLH
ncbi:MAG: MGMT family protein [Ghiorsea sp.]|nr:MGMT family protein [Ghiorsea sp.]